MRHLGEALDAVRTSGYARLSGKVRCEYLRFKILTCMLKELKLRNTTDTASRRAYDEAISHHME